MYSVRLWTYLRTVCSCVPICVQCTLVYLSTVCTVYSCEHICAQFALVYLSVYSVLLCTYLCTLHSCVPICVCTMYSCVPVCEQCTLMYLSVPRAWWVRCLHIPCLAVWSAGQNLNTMIFVNFCPQEFLHFFILFKPVWFKNAQKKSFCNDIFSFTFFPFLLQNYFRLKEIFSSRLSFCAYEFKEFTIYLMKFLILFLANFRLHFFVTKRHATILEQLATTQQFLASWH